MPRDSAAPYVMDITAFLPGQAAVVIPATEHFLSLSISRKAEGAWRGSMVLFDKNTTFIDDIILGLGPEGRLRIRWNWDGPGGSNLAAADTYIARLHKPMPKYTIDGLTMTVELMSADIYTQQFHRKPRSYPEQTKLSAIVADIAEDRGWRLVDDDGNPTVEESDEPVVGPFSTNGETDFAFIRHQLLPYAVNEQKDRYLFYFDQDKTGTPIVHFHSSAYQRGKAGGESVAATYLFSRDAFGEVIEFEPQDRTFEAAFAGAANSEVTGNDTMRGQPSNNPTDAERGDAESNRRIHQDERFKLAAPAERQAKIGMITRTEAELKQKAQHRYSRVNEMGQRAVMTVMGTHAVRVLDYVDVQYLRSDGRPHHMSGVYRVYEVEHEVGGTWQTTFNMARQGNRRTSGPAVVEQRGLLVEVDTTRTPEVESRQTRANVNVRETS